MIEIWTSNWEFFYKQTPSEKRKNIPGQKLIIKDVVCKKIPLRFLLNEGKDIQIKKELPIKIASKLTGECNVIFIKKIGVTN